MKKILVVVGTRPNFIKVTQFKRAADAYPDLEVRIVHTGQHFDKKMADDFFQQFSLFPDFFLNIDPGQDQGKQMEEITGKTEELIKTYQPALMIVVGDVNSTLAAARAAKKRNVPIAHVESGLRSFDSGMPEEFNRIETDKIASVFFVTEQSGIDHLLNEGKDAKSIHFAGNTMIDTMLAFQEQIKASAIMEKLGVKPKEFVLMTIHRPATVDSEEGLKKLIGLIELVTEGSKIIFPIHPRTLKNANKFGLLSSFSTNKRLILSDPLDYFSFQKLIAECAVVITDSGGIQEETTFLKIPCLTLRKNTERPVTISMGTNELIPFDLKMIKEKINAIKKGKSKKGSIPPYWDGKATERIMKIIHQLLSS